MPVGAGASGSEREVRALGAACLNQPSLSPSPSPPSPSSPSPSALAAEQKQHSERGSMAQPAAPAVPADAADAAPGGPQAPIASAAPPQHHPGAAIVKKKKASGTSSSTGAKGKKKKKTSSSKLGKRAAAPPPPPPSWVERLRQHTLQGPGLVAVCAVAGAVALWQGVRLLRRLRSPGGGAGGAGAGNAKAAPAPCAHVKPSAKCVALADGSACVVRRTIAADNSCMFNAVAYTMHGSKQKAAFLRNVVAREVSSDPETYSAVFLGMPNAAYCHWIVNPVNWGGGIELSILARHYTREIAAWNIESGKQHVFGEEAGYPKQVMLIYTGTHYDALAIAKHPRAPESEDKTEFNPRTKTGKMIIAAAQKLTELSKKGGKAGAAKSAAAAAKRPATAPPTANGTATAAAKATSSGSGAGPAGAAAGSQLKCEECQVVLGSQADAVQHATRTGHTRFAQVQGGGSAAAAPSKPSPPAAAPTAPVKAPSEPQQADAAQQAQPPKEAAAQGGG